MRKGLLLTTLLLGGFPAYAADLPTWPVKALPVATTCVPGNCSGWYAGFGLTGNGTNADVIGNGINGSVFAAGGALDVHGGYQLWNGSIYAAAEGKLGYWFNSAASSGVPITNNANLGNSFMGMELIKLGYNFFPNAGSSVTTPGQAAVPLTVPASLLASTTPYFVLGGMQRKGMSEWVNGAGLTTIVAAGWSTYAEYLYAPAQQGQAANQIVTVGLNKHF